MSSCPETIAAALSQPPLERNVAVGFDGYIDTILQVSRQGAQFGGSGFGLMKEFGDYIVRKAGKSCSLALRKRVTKMGGNMPNYAAALEKLDQKTICIGALGYPHISETFRELEQDCQLYSVCNPGRCDSLEFRDGKLMLAENGEIDNFDYSLLSARIPPKELSSLFMDSGTVAMLNWSEMKGATTIWRGLYEDVFSRQMEKSVPNFFFDFSDCSGRSTAEIREVADIVSLYAERWKVAVSLNRNEAEQFLGKLSLEAESDTAIVQQLQALFRCHTVLLHLTDGCGYVEGAQQGFVPKRVIEQPVLLTGGGDNFNAGYTWAALSGLEIEDAVTVGNAVSGYYVAKGNSPTRAQLRDWIDEELEKTKSRRLSATMKGKEEIR